MTGSGENVGGFPIVDLPSAADGPDAAVRLLVAELVRTGRLQDEAADDVIRRVWQRERLGSTAIGRGVAIPHARSRLVTEVVGVIGRCPQPIDWPGALDGAPLRAVCLVVVPDGPGLSIRELERVVRTLRAGLGSGN